MNERIIAKIGGFTLAVSGIGLELDFNAVRFLAEGIPFFVALASALVVVLAFNLAFILRRHSFLLLVFSVAVGLFSIASTSASQSWAFGHIVATEKAKEDHISDARTVVEALKADIVSLDGETTTLLRQRASAETLADLAQYRTVVSTIDTRFEAISRQRTADLAQLRLASEKVESESLEGHPTVYSYYQTLLGIPAGTLQIILHTALSLIITLSTPLGIIAIESSPQAAKKSTNLDAFYFPESFHATRPRKKEGKEAQAPSLLDDFKAP
jgi:hypothetical protein